MADAEPYRLTLTADGLRLERTLDRETALRILALVLGGDDTAIAVPTSSIVDGTPQLQAAPAATRPALSAREFLDGSQAVSNPEKITAFAVYLERYEGKTAFGRNDVKRKFAEAREAPPRNLNRDFVTAISYGWIHEDPNGRAYATSTGRNAVETAFTSVRRRARSSGSSAGGGLPLDSFDDEDEDV